MIISFFKKYNLLTKNYALIQKFWCSALPHLQNLPKEDAKYDITRKNKELFKEHLIENLFLNKIQLTVFEYPEIDSLKEVESLDKINQSIKNVLNNQIKANDKIDDLQTSEALVHLKNLELSGFQLPVSKGGYGFLDLESTFIQETLRSVNSSLATMVAENENFGIELIKQCGTKSQKEKYLLKLAKGESLACFAYLESEHFDSLDPVSVNLKAVKSDNETFLVSGKKHWVYNANHADILIFLANVISTNNEQVKNPTLFLVDKNMKGITVHEPIKTVGLKDVNISSISFNEVEIPSDCILGKPEESEKLFRKIFSKRKLSDGIQCLVTMKKLVNLAISHCINNSVFKKDLWEREPFKIEIGKLVSRLYAVESMIYLIAGRLDHFNDADVYLESLILKIVSSETLQYIFHQIVAVLGTKFYAEENKNLRELATDCHFFLSCEHSNDYLRALISSAGCKHVFEYRSNRSALTLLKDLNIQQEYQEMSNPRNKLSFNACFKVYGYAHKMFKEQTLYVEDVVFLLKKTVDYLLKKHDKNIYKRHFEIQMLANLVLNIYSMIAILGRSNRAYCLGFYLNETDRMIAEYEILRLKAECENVASLIKNKNFIQNFSDLQNKIGNTASYGGNFFNIQS